MAELYDYPVVMNEEGNNGVWGPLKVVSVAAGGLTHKFVGRKQRKSNTQSHGEFIKPYFEADSQNTEIKTRGAAAQFVLAALPGSRNMFKPAEGCTVVILSDTVRL